MFVSFIKNDYYFKLPDERELNQFFCNFFTRFEKPKANEVKIEYRNGRPHHPSADCHCIDHIVLRGSASGYFRCDWVDIGIITYRDKPDYVLPAV